MLNRMAIATAPGVLNFTESEMPLLQPHQILIKIKATSICGSDLHIVKGKHPSAPLPVAVGHEFAGEIVEMGTAVNRFSLGDRVTVEPVLICGQCPPCKQGQYGYCDNLSFHYRQGQGAFANYFIADEDFVYTLPEHLSYEAGALIEPLAVAVHAVQRAKIGLRDKVLVLGAGAIGLLITAVVRICGVQDIVVVDLAPYRLAKAKALGASRIINPREESVDHVIQELTSGRGMDKTFECVGLEQTLTQAMNLLRKGGLATIVGIFESTEVRIPAPLFVAKEITVQGSQGYCWDFPTALSLTQNIDLTEMITHVLPLSQVQAGFDAALDPNSQAIKVVLQPE